MGMVRALRKLTADANHCVRRAKVDSGREIPEAAVEVYWSKPSELRLRENTKKISLFSPLPPVQMPFAISGF